MSRSTRGGQRVFINGRAVENGIVNQALREGYHTALMKGRYPVVYLFIEMDPAAVDVNVHPAKREVRFREPGTVREALVAAVRRTLEAGRADWSRSFHQPPLPDAATTLAAPTAGVRAANGVADRVSRPAIPAPSAGGFPGDGGAARGSAAAFPAPTDTGRNAREPPARAGAPASSRSSACWAGCTS